MYIFKQPHIGGEVGCHQDATFLYTDPMTVTGFWFAIEDATLENGCLWAAPGGHRTPAAQGVQARAAASDDDGTEFEVLDDDAAARLRPTSWCRSRCRPGRWSCSHGLLPHWSDVNRSPHSRHAYSLHCISAAADYPAWNWLQRPADMPLRRLDRHDAASSAR